MYNLATNLLIKQLLMNIIEYLGYLLKNGLKIWKIEKEYNKDIAVLESFSDQDKI